MEDEVLGIVEENGPIWPVFLAGLVKEPFVGQKDHTLGNWLLKSLNRTLDVMPSTYQSLVI